jgi:hypothetical protein
MLIEIKNAKNKWKVVELISINDDNTITIKHRGQIIKRKTDRVKWEATYKVPKEQGYSNNKPKKDKKFKSKRKRNKYKTKKVYKKTKNNQENSSNKKRRIVHIAGHKVNFL